jgi:hypothetical protein
MKTKSTIIITKNKNILLIALATAFILMVPFLAMQFTDDVVWSPTDFAVAGTLLFGTGLAYELISKRTNKTSYRVAIGIALATVLFLVWVELAVGIFD